MQRLLFNSVRLRVINMKNIKNLFGLKINIRSTLRGMTVVFLLLLVARLIGMIKELIVAYRYGVSPIIDGYLFVFNNVFLISTISESVMVFVLVPLILRWRISRSSPRVIEFKGELLGVMAISSLGTALIFVVVIPYMIRWEVFGLTAEATEAALQAAWWLPYGLVPALLATVVFAWAVAHERHISSLGDALPAIGIVTAVLCLPQPSITPLIVGTLVGFLLRYLFLAWIDYKAGDYVWPRLRFRSELWREFLQGMSMMMVAQSILVLTNLVDTFFAIRLGEGALATYNYAYRLIAVPLSLLSISVSRVIISFFSKINHSSENVEQLMVFSWLVWWVLGIGGVIAGIGWLASEVVVRLIYERGAFTSEDTIVVTAVLRMLCLQFPVYMGWIVVFYWLASQLAYRTLFKASTLVLFTKILTAWVLSGFYGLAGLALSTTIMYLLGLGYTFMAAYISASTGGSNDRSS
ncbi:MAG: lipid II flippase MurJ [Armatimonadota bacterium]